MKKKLIGLATVSVLALSSQMASASEMVPAQIVDNNISSSSYETASQQEIIYGLQWNRYTDATKYQVGLFDITDNKKITLDQPYTTDRSYNFPLLKPYHEYRGWVGAYDSKGTLIAQGQTNFKTKEVWGDKTQVFRFQVELKKN
ncbi:hypothetical protein P9597_04810 [Aneurinibacillus migulanus]|nr:hypothetical protein [Aneurinibacillus migulanus]